MSEFIKKTRPATMKQVQNLATASDLGLLLAAGTGETSTADVYKVRTAWDHREKSRRAKCIRVMGTEADGCHEVWLTLWSKHSADIEAIGAAVTGAPEWNGAPDSATGTRYERGPVSLEINREKGTATLICREKRASPFTASEFCDRLGGLYDGLEALEVVAAQPAKEPPPAEQAPTEEAPVAEIVETEETVETEDGGPGGEATTGSEAATQVYEGPAELAAALELGKIDLCAGSARIRLEAHEVEVAVVDDRRNKQIMLTVAGLGDLDAGMLASCRARLGDRAYTVRPDDGGQLVILRKSTTSMPPPGTIREAMDYAASFLRDMESMRHPPPAPPVEAPPPAAPVEAPLPAPPAEAPPTPPAEAPTGDAIEVEEVSLDELLGPSEATAAAAPEETELPAPPDETELPAPSDEAELPAPSAEAELPAPPAEGETPAPPDGAAPAEAGQPVPEAPGPRRSSTQTAILKLQAQLRELQGKLADEEGTSVPAKAAGPAEPEAEPEPPGEVPATAFGDFRAVRWLGRDALGVLYEGENTKTGGPAVIKVIDKEHTQNVRFAKNFVREGWVAAKLEHPGINRMLTVGRTKDHTYYYASEFVQARSARAIVGSSGPFAVAEAGRVVRAVAEAMAYVHSKKLYHGDIRPSYVLIVPDGGVKLAEMAVAKNVLDCIERLLQSCGWGLTDALKDERGEARKEMDRIVRERRVIGFYLAPELADSHVQADGRADIYGLGAVWYCLLTGEPPFKKEDVLDLLLGKTGRAAPPHEIRPDVPPEVSAIVHKMMEPLPSERYQSMEEVIAEIDRTKGA